MGNRQTGVHPPPEARQKARQTAVRALESLDAGEGRSTARTRRRRPIASAASKPYWGGMAGGG
jgi:hypothetical protein